MEQVNQIKEHYRQKSVSIKKSLPTHLRMLSYRFFQQLQQQQTTMKKCSSFFSIVLKKTRKKFK